MLFLIHKHNCMNNKCLITLLSTLVLMTGSCCKEKTMSVSKQATKIKSLKYVDQNTLDTLKYYFHYDSLNQVDKISDGTTELFLVSKINNNTIKIASGDQNFVFFTHLNAQNRIICINTNEEYITPDAQSFYATYNTNTTFADTILHPDYFYFPFGNYYVFTNISSFDFRFYNGNCINHKMSSMVTYGGINPEEPKLENFSIDMDYNTSLKNNNLLPFQNSYPYMLGIYSDIFYLLGLNGYYYIQPNANLLQSKQDITLGGDNRPSYRTTYYEYKTDANQNVTEMCVRHYSNIDSCDKYFFEYY